ncbi:DUF3862 domain-containing protein [Geotalea sp. SG265]|uniref:DUF3862 domain-containing protein n=1 Tax=Geotalea sp. SG265 TaxID=2922867 RepID=UPI001FB02C25|nr:DUF3862 domain-containing protein [Geotalea sp. SG265]
MRFFMPVMLLLLLLVSGCSRLTMANYDKIKMGMEYDQVTAILGKPDNCSDALIARSCIWGSEEKNITVNFVGGKAILFTSKNIR